MKGKKTFTREEAEKIRILINKKVRASKYEQKRIRDEIRAIGFYFSDFSNKKGYTVDDFEFLIRNKQIEITSMNVEAVTIPQKSPIEKDTLTDKDEQIKLENGLITKAKYYLAENIDSLIPKDKTGFYSIRLVNGKSLPERYQSILNKRPHKLIYIGRAEGQYLHKRYLQELRAVGHGTFFRSIGAVLGFLPVKGSLVGQSNQNNYRFSPEDNKKIIQWINSNLEVSWVSYSDDFSIEEKLIKKYCPLLNGTHNPLSLSELREDKDKCRVAARGGN